MSMQQPPGLRVLMTGLLTTLLFVAPMAVLAQHGDQTPGSPHGATPPENEALAAREQVKQLRQQLEGIRDRALQGSPSLQQRQQELQQKVNERMAERGVDMQADLQRLREIAGQLRDPGLEKAKQQELADEYRRMREELMAARDAVLEDQEVQEARKRFGEELRVAMKEVEPEVEEIIRRYQDARAEFRRRMQSAHQGMQGQGRQGHQGMQTD